MKIKKQKNPKNILLACHGKIHDCNLNYYNLTTLDKNQNSKPDIILDLESNIDFRKINTGLEQFDEIYLRNCPFYIWSHRGLANKIFFKNIWYLLKRKKSYCIINNFDLLKITDKRPLQTIILEFISTIDNLFNVKYVIDEKNLNFWSFPVKFKKHYYKFSGWDSDETVPGNHRIMLILEKI